MCTRQQTLRGTSPSLRDRAHDRKPRRRPRLRKSCSGRVASSCMGARHWSGPANWRICTVRHHRGPCQWTGALAGDSESRMDQPWPCRQTRSQAVATAPSSRARGRSLRLTYPSASTKYCRVVAGNINVHRVPRVLILCDGLPRCEDRTMGVAHFPDGEFRLCRRRPHALCPQALSVWIRAWPE